MLTRLVGEYELELQWRGFELHPETPPGGAALSSLFPASRLPGMKAHVASFAASVGVAMGHPDRLPNTRRVLAIAEYARDAGQLDAFRHAAMEAHWNRGLDLEADADLRALSAEAGLDPDAAIAAAIAPAWVARVDAMGAEARRWGVTGIPTYFLLPAGWDLGHPLPPAGSPRPVRIVGCQPRDVVERGCAVAGVPRRSAGPR